MTTLTSLFSYRPHWAKRLGVAPFLPMSRAEMDALGWDACDIILVTGDAYIDHPSFGMALIGRLLEAQGFRVGIISQPDWQSPQAFRALGQPTLFFGVTAGNMDSMVNRYTSDKKIRSDDAYTPEAKAGARPDRAVIVYTQRCREAYKHVPVVIGSIEASLRRIAHYDYWSEKVRRSILVDSKADMLIFGNAERALVALSHRLAKGEAIADIRDLRGTAVMVPLGWRPDETFIEKDERYLPKNFSQNLIRAQNPYEAPNACESKPEAGAPISIAPPISKQAAAHALRAKTIVRLPSFEAVRDDRLLYAHASRTFHLESNPGNARALVQAHGDRDLFLNPPPIPLSMAEMDGVYALPYQRAPHPCYGNAKIPAWEMIRNSISIMRGCFGGCTFCSITEHEGRIIQSRSEDSILQEIKAITEKGKQNGFTGTISDLGGPTANMYRMACKEEAIENACRRLSCVYPEICKNLNTDHTPLIALYRKARKMTGVKKILIGSGVRYDLAATSPEYVRELATHHVGGYLKIAPEHTEKTPLSLMMKPEMTAYEAFRTLFERFSKEAGKEQYLIPYFIAAHPGSSQEDMLNLALWLKKQGFRLDQVQTFLPTPLALATTMYHTRQNPLQKIQKKAKEIEVVTGERARKLQKAFLRYHDPNNWEMLREALRAMGKKDLIGNAKHQLVPTFSVKFPPKKSRG